MSKLAGLQNLVRQLLLRRRDPLAAGAGLVLAAAFPNLGVAGLGWIAPGLLLAAAHNQAGGDAFRTGYVGGIAFALGSLSWLLRIPANGFPILGWLALAAYTGLYLGVWVWMLAGRIGQGSWPRRFCWNLLGAAAWVGLEMVRSRFLSGFPWNLLGTSQYQEVPLIQVAAYTGVYGVSFLMVWSSLSIYSATVAILRQPTTRYIWLGDMILPMVAVLAVFVAGAVRLRTLASSGESGTFQVTLVQPSIPQTMIWRAADDARRFGELVQLTRDALTNQTDLLLWPEAAVPKMIRYDEPTLQTITGLARSNHVWMIVGSDDAQPARAGGNPGETEYLNASFLINPKGILERRYSKRKLVIFGEYVPLAKWLPFLKWFTPIDSGFTAGADGVVTFEMKRRTPVAGIPISGVGPNLAFDPELVRTATLICFEDVFPHLVPEYVGTNTDFLVNLTNDGWFGEGGEQWQHAASGVFRAVENGVPLLRCCNNGITCWIDAGGVMREVFRDSKGGVHGAGIMTATIPLRAAAAPRPATYYTRHGDRFGWNCVGLTALVLFLNWRKRFRREPVAPVAPAAPVA